MTTSNSRSNLDGGLSQPIFYGLGYYCEYKPPPGPSPLASQPVWPFTSPYLARSLRLLGASLRVIFCVSLMSFALLAEVADLGSYISMHFGQVAMVRTLSSLFPYHPELRVRSSIREQDLNRPLLSTP